jgi:glycosyltransferase involved in cell wall biosynthesis
LVENAVLYTRKDVDSLNRLFKKNNISHKMIIPLTSESFIDTPFNISDRTNSILYVGRLEPFQKQIKKLIKMSKFLDTDIHVYGDGPYLKHVNTNPNRIKYMGTFNNAN